MSAFTEGKHSAISELDEISDRLRKFVAWLNQRSAWETALKAQMALVAVNDINDGAEADLEESYP